MLTAKQYKAHTYICDRISKSGVAPSYSEIQAHLGLASKSGVNAVLNALEDRGYVRRIKFHARAIQVLKQPNGEMTISARVAVSGLVSAAEAVVEHDAGLQCLSDALASYRETHGKTL